MDWTQDFPADLRETLASVGELQEFGDGAMVIRKGDCDTHLFHLLAGQVSVVTDSGYKFLGAGELLGEIAFLDNRPRTASACAVGMVKARRIDRQKLLQALSDRPRALATLLATLTAVHESRTDSGGGCLDLDPHKFVDELAQSALSHRAVCHPYLRAMAAGDLPDTRWALADFARHYYGYSAHFPRYLTALISRLESPAHRTALLANLTEESGQYAGKDLELLAEVGIQREWIVGVPHPELFQRFRAAIGVEDEAPSEEHIEVTCWREMFLNLLANGSPAEALGALGVGTENIVRHIYPAFVSALERDGTISARDTVFFPLHAIVDDHHQAALQELAADLSLTREARMDLTRGMHKSLALRASFWSWLHERALEPESCRDG